MHENARVSLFSEGYAEVTGGTTWVQIFVGGRFSTTVPSAIIQEAGAFDRLASTVFAPTDEKDPSKCTTSFVYHGLLFFRTWYGKNPIDHKQYQTIYTICQRIG
jgi:hypothetical protein